MERPMSNPRTVYLELLARRRLEIAGRERQHRRFGYYRLAAIAAALALVGLALASGAFSIAWALVPVAAFVALAIIHDRLLGGLEHARRAARFSERGLARLDDQWAGAGTTGEAYLDSAHPYARDLDLFGRGSLFELLSTARTHIGEETLAGWLLDPAAPDAVRARQQAVEELRERVDLREDLAVVAEQARTGIDAVSLAAWGESPARLNRPAFRAVLAALTAGGVLAAGAVFVLSAAAVGALPAGEPVRLLLRDALLLLLAANGWFLYRVRVKVGAVVAEVEEAAHELRLFSGVLLRLERERFHSPLLTELRALLDGAGEPPSHRLARLDRLMDLLDSRDNVFVRLLEVFVLWTPHMALRVEDWRRRSGPLVRGWLRALGELEALCSLASHAFEHPADPFPEFSAGAALFEAEGIAHPLLPAGRAVRNDVAAGGAAPHVLVVSGSNMSGKSTLLRTIGVNAVLAQAGAPVRARRLRLSPLAVGASIQVTDSLERGVSRFYAEILRIRQIVDRTAGALPVLFLIDEFLHGTNSHDRRIGAEALVLGLMRRGAIGWITTHDLALADIGSPAGGVVENVHFEDHIENGRIQFDYVLRPGVVRKSNALELMRSVGLEI
jgi:hypothetical protein